MHAVPTNQIVYILHFNDKRTEKIFFERRESVWDKCKNLTHLTIIIIIIILKFKIFFDKYCPVKYLMGRKCCVANCKWNYDKQTKVKVYKLPRNFEERKRWLTIIAWDNISVDKNSCMWKTLAWKLSCKTRLWQRKTKRFSFCIYMSESISSNITTTKKKYRQSIGRSKEFITWWERPFFRERQYKRF